MSKDNYILPFACSDITLPLILCRTKEGKEFLALIDTGSEVTLIDKSLESEASPMDGSGDEIILHSMHGEDETSSKLWSVPTSVTDLCDKERFLVIKGFLSDLKHISDFLKNTHRLDIETLAVIGSDTLSRAGAVIDCELGQIKL